MTNSAQSSNSLSQYNLTTSSDLSKRINSIRFLLIVLVIFIHSNPLSLLDASYINNLPVITNFVITSIATVIASLAVPCFFLISAYLLYTKETKFIPVLKKKSRTLLLPYFIGNLLEVLVRFMGQSFEIFKPYFKHYIIRDFGISDGLAAFIRQTLINTQYHAPFAIPIAFALGFIRDLFVLSLSFLAIKKVIDKFPFLTIITMFILGTSCINIYIVSTEALLFFSLGYYVVKYSLDYKKLDTIKTTDIAILYAITIIIENFGIEKVPIIHNINIIIGIIAFIKLSKYLVSKPKLYSSLLKWNAYTFFVYAFHAIVTLSAIRICTKTLPINGYWLILQFFIVALFGITTSLTAGILIKKYFSKIYSVLTGERIYG